MSTLSAAADAPPVRADADGTMRVGESRLLLELVIRAFEDGSTPETIVQRYSTLALSDVYAVIGWYLRRRGEVNAYLAVRERQAASVAALLAGRQGDLAGIRARLQARREAADQP